ncbi:MAG: hypothetical protein FVQ80_19335 [Planctomycetes bacterium]|nr:hypothetical protein [Planctomycetota bacterium]
MFSNQNCELTVKDSGHLQLTYLDGDHLGIKDNLAKLLEKRKKIELNKVSWWGDRALEICIKEKYDF